LRENYRVYNYCKQEFNYATPLKDRAIVKSARVRYDGDSCEISIQYPNNLSSQIFTKEGSIIFVTYIDRELSNGQFDANDIFLSDKETDYTTRRLRASSEQNQLLLIDAVEYEKEGLGLKLMDVYLDGVFNHLLSE